MLDRQLEKQLDAINLKCYAYLFIAFIVEKDESSTA